MKVFIVAFCLFGLALAYPGGDKGGDRPEGGKGKGGPRGPIGGLVKLCISLAEAAEEEGAKKRQFDFEEALVEICEFLLFEKPEKTTAAQTGRAVHEDHSTLISEASGEAPEERSQKFQTGRAVHEDHSTLISEASGEAPEERSQKFQAGRAVHEDYSTLISAASGEAPEEIYINRGIGKGDRQDAGGDRQGAGEGQDGERDIVDVLVRICGGLAKMAEEAEVEARAVETKGDLLEAMKVVCDAAEAEAEARTTPASA